MLADAVPYSGHTGEGLRVVVEVRGRTVVAVRAGLRRYRCETFGDLGPIVVREAGAAPIGRDGRFTFAAGPPAQRLVVTGRLMRGGSGARGRLRVRGTIATGQRCASATVHWTAARSVQARR